VGLKRPLLHASERLFPAPPTEAPQHGLMAARLDAVRTALDAFALDPVLLAESFERAGQKLALNSTSRKSLSIIRVPEPDLSDEVVLLYFNTRVLKLTYKSLEACPADSRWRASVCWCGSDRWWKNAVAWHRSITSPPERRNTRRL
jgi:hypothetical protein